MKETFMEAWKIDHDILDQTSRHHFRNDLDVNQWFIRLHQIMEGKFAVRKPIRNAVFTLGKDNGALVNAVRNQKKPVVCINDQTIDDDTYSRAKLEIISAFQKILPEESEFEIKR